jgi:hypothetical protein
MKLKVHSTVETKQNYGAGWGTESITEYVCPCGGSTVREEIDQVPGFRDRDLWCYCPKCRDKYDFDFGGIAKEKTVDKKVEV